MKDSPHVAVHKELPSLGAHVCVENRLSLLMKIHTIHPSILISIWSQPQKKENQPERRLPFWTLLAPEKENSKILQENETKSA